MDGSQASSSAAQGLADQADIGRSVARQLALDALGRLRHEVGIAAVEVDAVGEVEAADRIAHHPLRQADGIGGGHEHDLALDPALGLERRQALAQVMRRDHAGDLVGMERGLDVDLRAGAFRAEALDGQRQVRPGGEGRKGDLFCSHDQSMQVWQESAGRRGPVR